MICHIEDATHLMGLILHANNSNGYINIIKDKIRKNPKIINSKNYERQTPLMMACLNNCEISSAKILKFLLKQPYVKINSVDQYGETALMIACHGNGRVCKKRIIDLLLGRDDLDINITNRIGWTALMLSCSSTGSNVEIVKSLLCHPKIDLNIQEHTNKYTALMISCDYYRRHKCIDIVRVLLNHPKTNVNIHGRNKYSALTLACQYALFSKESTCLELTELILSHLDVEINKKFIVRTNKRIIGIFHYLCSIANRIIFDDLARGFLSENDTCVFLGTRSKCHAYETLTKILGLFFRHKNFNVEDLEYSDFQVIFSFYYKTRDEKNTALDTLLEIMFYRDIKKDILRLIIKNYSCSWELLLSHILCPVNLDYGLISTTLENCDQKEKILYYFDLHINTKKTVSRDIINRCRKLL